MYPAIEIDLIIAIANCAQMFINMYNMYTVDAKKSLRSVVVS